MEKLIHVNREHLSRRHCADDNLLLSGNLQGFPAKNNNLPEESVKNRKNNMVENKYG